MGSRGPQRTHHRDVVLFAVPRVRAGDALCGDGAAVLGGSRVEGVAVGRRQGVNPGAYPASRRALALTPPDRPLPSMIRLRLDTERGQFFSLHRRRKPSPELPTAISSRTQPSWHMA